MKLEAKEGLALINGTHLMAAQGALLSVDLGRVFDAALVACAMSIDAARATETGAALVVGERERRATVRHPHRRPAPPSPRSAGAAKAS